MKRWISAGLGGRAVSPDLALLVVRAGFGASMAFAHGFGKFGRLEPFGAKIARWGVPFGTFWALCAALAESLGALCMALGLLTRPAAALLGFSMLVAVSVAHAGDPFSKRELALAYLAVALAVVIAGPGRYSLDARLRRRLGGG